MGGTDEAFTLVARIGVLTTSGAFLSLVFADYRALAQFDLLTASGLVITLVVSGATDAVDRELAWLMDDPQTGSKRNRRSLGSCGCEFFGNQESRYFFAVTPVTRRRLCGSNRMLRSLLTIFWLSLRTWRRIFASCGTRLKATSTRSSKASTGGGR